MQNQLAERDSILLSQGQPEPGPVPYPCYERGQALKLRIEDELKNKRKDSNRALGTPDQLRELKCRTVGNDGSKVKSWKPKTKSKPLAVPMPPVCICWTGFILGCYY